MNLQDPYRFLLLLLFFVVFFESLVVRLRVVRASVVCSCVVCGCVVCSCVVCSCVVCSCVVCGCVVCSCVVCLVSAVVAVIKNFYLIKSSKPLYLHSELSSASSKSCARVNEQNNPSRTIPLNNKAYLIPKNKSP